MRNAGSAVVLAVAGTVHADALTAQPKMGDPLAGLTESELVAFVVGATAYETNITESEGLGPIFNARRCSVCHLTPLGGFGTQGGATKQLTNRRAGVLDGETFDPLEELGGSLFQDRANPNSCEETIPPEANIVSGRTGIGMLGYGLVEAIPDEAILAHEDPDDADGDGVSGRAHMVEPLEDPGTLRVGRFGWKAQVATILSFSANAALQEIGLTNRLEPVENDPNGINFPNLGDPEFCDPVLDPEDNVDLGNGVDKEFIDVVTDFQRYLAAPPQTPRSGMTGEAIFEQIGCATCHVSTFTTVDDEALEEALRNKEIHPYSDFLLHDMGEAADFISQGDAGIREMRTPPLWGLRKRAFYWHNARVFGDDFGDRVREAILAHLSPGSESEASVDAYRALPVADQDALVAFLGSLGRLEFDHDADEVIDAADFNDFRACSAIGETIVADDPCAVHDVDQDGDIDIDDLNVLVTVYEGLQLDCNANAVNDLIDIFEGASLDEDGDGVPDECAENQAAVLTALEVKTGTLLAGDVVSLGLSDDDRVEIDAVTFDIFHRIRMEVDATSADTTVAVLDLTIEASADSDAVVLFVDLRNWGVLEWDPVATLTLGPDDTEYLVLDVPDPGRFLDAGTGAISLRLSARADNDDVPDGYILRVDHVKIEVTP